MPKRNVVLTISPAIAAWREGGLKEPPEEVVAVVRDCARRVVATQLQIEFDGSEDIATTLRTSVENALFGGLDEKTVRRLAPVVHAVIKELIEKPPAELTRMLWKWAESEHNPELDARVYELIYKHLRDIASAKLSTQYRMGRKIEAADLVSMLYIQLRAAKIPRLWASKRQFYSMVGEALTNILRDMHKSERRLKRPQIDSSVSITHVMNRAGQRKIEDYFVMQSALEKLRQIDPRQEEVFMLRHVHGLPVEQIASMMLCSEITIKRATASARANLQMLLR